VMNSKASLDDLKRIEHQLKKYDEVIDGLKKRKALVTDRQWRGNVVLQNDWYTDNEKLDVEWKLTSSYSAGITNCFLKDGIGCGDNFHNKCGHSKCLKFIVSVNNTNNKLKTNGSSTRRYFHDDDINDGFYDFSFSLTRDKPVLKYWFPDKKPTKEEQLLDEILYFDKLDKYKIWLANESPKIIQWIRETTLKHILPVALEPEQINKLRTNNENYSFWYLKLED